MLTSVLTGMLKRALSLAKVLEFGRRPPNIAQLADLTRLTFAWNRGGAKHFRIHTAPNSPMSASMDL